MHWGKQTKRPRQALQAKTTSEESGNPDNNNLSCRFHVGEKDVDKEDEFKVPVHVVQNRYFLV